MSARHMLLGEVVPLLSHTCCAIDLAFVDYDLTRRCENIFAKLSANIVGLLIRQTVEPAEKMLDRLGNRCGRPFGSGGRHCNGLVMSRSRGC